MKTSQQGFTLIEAMIAIGILAIGIGAILTAENNSLDVTLRAKRMTTVATLARNTMIKTEREIQAKTFTEVKEEDSGKFDAPYAEYSWERKIKEIKFPNLLDPTQSSGGAGGDSKPAAKSDLPTTEDPNITRVVKLATQYLSKSSREITITIKWKDKGEKQQFTVSQYWVDLKHEFSINESPD